MFTNRYKYTIAAYAFTPSELLINYTKKRERNPPISIPLQLNPNKSNPTNRKLLKESLYKCLQYTYFDNTNICTKYIYFQIFYCFFYLLTENL